MNHTARIHGNPTAKAWLAGWDASVSGLPGQINPYLRRPQSEAWDCGFREGLRSGKRAAHVTQQRTPCGPSCLTVISGGKESVNAHPERALNGDRSNTRVPDRNPIAGE